MLEHDDGEPRLAVVHRPHRVDWTFPKGKLEAGETDEEAALREVLEETGFSCRVEGYLGETRYVDNRGRDKVVAYYLMTRVAGEFRPNDEVDALVFLGLDDASGLLTYPRDRELCAVAAARLAA